MNGRVQLRRRRPRRLRTTDIHCGSACGQLSSDCDIRTTSEGFLRPTTDSRAPIFTTTPIVACEVHFVDFDSFGNNIRSASVWRIHTTYQTRMSSQNHLTRSEFSTYLPYKSTGKRSGRRRTASGVLMTQSISP